MELCGKPHALAVLSSVEYVPRYLLNRRLDASQGCLNVFRKIRVTCCYQESHQNPPVVKPVACHYADRHRGSESMGRVQVLYSVNLYNSFSLQCGPG